MNGPMARLLTLPGERMSEGRFVSVQGLFLGVHVTTFFQYIFYYKVSFCLTVNIF